MDDYQKLCDIATVHRQTQQDKLEARIHVESILTVGYQGVQFCADPQTIMFIDMLIKDGHTMYPIFGMNFEPALIEDLVQFKELLMERYTEAANYSWKQYQKLPNQDTIKSVIEKFK